MANTKVTGDLIASLTIATGNIADNAVTSAKISGITTAHITEGSNLYYTDARARAAVSVSGNALSYNSSTGVITSNFEESPTFTGNVSLISSSTVNLRVTDGTQNIYVGSSGSTRFGLSSGASIIQSTSAAFGIGTQDGQNLTLGTNNTARLTILSSGNIGIGTTSPSYKLEVVKTGADGINVDVGSDFGGIRLTSSTGAWSIRTSTGDDLFFYDVDNTNQAVTFKRGGFVGIGNTNPAVELDIYDSTGNSAIRLSGGAANNEAYQIQQGIDGVSNGGFAIRNVTNGSNPFIIQYSTENVGIGTSSPGDKLEVSSGNIRITNNSPMLRFRDSDITNLEHRVLGGGNQGLEYSADVNNVTAGYHRWDIANSEKMRLIENGNLGIGTTSPSYKLHISGGDVFTSADKGYIASYNNTTSYHGALRWAALQLGNNGGNRIIAGRTATGGVLDFYTNNTNDASTYSVTPDGNHVMRMAANGDVGIGTFSPGSISGSVHTLTLGGTNGSLSGGTMFQANGTNTATHYYENSTFRYQNIGAYDHVFLASNTSELMRIKSGGNVGIGTTGPGYKLHVNGDVHAAGAAYLTATNSSYTNDGLYNSNARPSQVNTPGGQKILFGYKDNGAGGYFPRIGFRQDYNSVNSPNTTSAKTSLGLESDGRISFKVGASNAVEALSIKPDGKIGMGVTSPASKLTVDGVIELDESSGAHGYLNTDGTNFEFDLNRNPVTGGFSDSNKGHARMAMRAEDGGAGSRIIFTTAAAANTVASERMRIDKNGFIYNPSMGAGSGEPSVLWWSGSNSSYGQSGMLIRDSSSRVFKKNERASVIDTSKIFDLELKDFEWNEKSVTEDRSDFGLIAEDVDEILPELVVKKDNEYFTVRYNMIGILAVQELKKANNEIELLKAEIEQLKTQINN